MHAAYAMNAQHPFGVEGRATLMRSCHAACVWALCVFVKFGERLNLCPTCMHALLLWSWKELLPNSIMCALLGF